MNVHCCYSIKRQFYPLNSFWNLIVTLHFDDVIEDLFSPLLNISFHHYIPNLLFLNLLLPLINYLYLILFLLYLLLSFILLSINFHWMLMCNFWNHKYFFYFKINQNQQILKSGFCLILILSISFHSYFKIEILLVI